MLDSSDEIHKVLDLVINVISTSYLLGSNIISRHQFLMETIGTRPEEDNSYNSVITLIVTFTVSIVLCSLLEMVGYFLYNMKV